MKKDFSNIPFPPLNLILHICTLVNELNGQFNEFSISEAKNQLRCDHHINKHMKAILGSNSLEEFRKKILLFQGTVDSLLKSYKNSSLVFTEKIAIEDILKQLAQDLKTLQNTTS
ncbi:hypothetical protein [Aequorivita echinoideorum]|uniref:HPt domain-containing protein n=1 Tax=Aequorivita echinoideorum TaxID=1549647 RepID=A0ABS5S2Z6_9FLAO|nr:hypothetical protein [Aequorivita echinoideorum]MBT0607571.1 hypothetical protein [Aequorivita echinoideorum]